VKYELRHYQRAAVDACWEYIEKQKGKNPCIVLPTGAGKSLVIATLIREAVTEWQGRVLLLSHVKELLTQTADHIKAVAPDLAGAIGIHSAGLRSRDKDHPVIVAGIQSVFKKACELGRFDIILVDEAHTIPDSGEGMYRTFLEESRIVNPEVRLIGLTATPYRMKTGYICGPDNLLNEICYEISVKQLIEEGFLCNLISKAGVVKADLSGVQVRGGEYVADSLEEAMDTDVLVQAACKEIVECTHNRRSNLIFASGVKHGGHIAQAIRGYGEGVSEVYGETPSKERDAVLAAFKRGEIKHIVSVGVLTTGFDARNIDCISLLRPTMSPGLYYQMLGRGLRINDGKDNCLILDFASNVLTHGPIDMIKVKPKKLGEPGQAPVKECPDCHGIIHAALTECPHCGHLFGREPNHEHQASYAAPVSGQNRTEVRPVVSIHYSEHYKRSSSEDSPPTMRVEYVTSTGLLRESVSEWICIEHDGWARQKAASWWSQRSLAPCPASVDEAVALAKAGALATCEAITVSVIAGEKWPKIVGYKLGARPEYSTPETGWSTFEEALEEQRRTTGAYDDDKPEEHPRVLEVIELFGGSTVQIDSSKAGHFDEEGRWVPPQAPKKLRALGDMNDLPW
jgi:DNA repair protein RadD